MQVLISLLHLDLYAFPATPWAPTFFPLPRHPHHPVQLQALQAALLRAAGAALDLGAGELLVDNVAHPLAAALHRHRQRARAPA